MTIFKHRVLFYFSDVGEEGSIVGVLAKKDRLQINRDLDTYVSLTLHVLFDTIEPNWNICEYNKSLD